MSEVSQRRVLTRREWRSKAPRLVCCLDKAKEEDRREASERVKRADKPEREYTNVKKVGIARGCSGRVAK